MDQEKSLVRAKDCAYRLLSYRPRSIKEINDRLKKKGFSPTIIKKTIDSLKKINYLNDEEFAKSWVRSRLQLRPSGLSLLRYELRQKGIAEDTADEVINLAADEYDESEAAKEVASARCKAYRHLEPQKRRLRLYGYLRRRGFSQDAIMKAMKL